MFLPQLPTLTIGSLKDRVFHQAGAHSASSEKGRLGRAITFQLLQRTDSPQKKDLRKIGLPSNFSISGR